MTTKKILATIFAAMVPAYASLMAQVPNQKKSIDITSTFKPVLREAAKINFNAAPPVADTSHPKLNYTVPSNTLFFTYQPAELKPVALMVDSFTAWQYSNFIKAGIGNVHQPYVEAGFSFGNSTNTFFNIFAKHYTSKGDLPFQKNSLSSVGVNGTYRTQKNHEWTGSAGFRSDDYYLYGFRPDSLDFDKQDLRQRFQTIEAKLHYRNIAPTEFGLSYQPGIQVSVFADNHTPKASEANTVVTLPLQKTFGRSIGFNLSATADLTNYRHELATKKSIQNNLYLISPAVIYKTPNLFLHGGLLPSWDQGSFHMLPNLMAEITTNDNRFTVQAGLVGYYNKGSYQRFASINPWLAQPDSLLNTRVQEGYAGFKGTTGGHFSYSAKLGLQQHRNMPLFVNDTIDGKTFEIIYEPRMNILQLHAEGEYSMGEQFTARAVINWNQYSKLKQEKRAWGVLPFELNASIRWQVLKDLWFRSELWTWAGAPYRVKNLDNRKGQSAFDLNAGAEFRITKNFNLWVQMNNILNNRYERWNQYQVYGFNILGGVVYSFNQK
ncbi:MAG TPA: hypothetical protein VM012_05590 [Flavitalea sp.]|nr:hypothetical protein [Flavitalea sp.]